jgi:hypothetical protein
VSLSGFPSIANSRTYSYGHEHMFLRDFKRLGMTRAAGEPPPTIPVHRILLRGYPQLSVNKQGRPRQRSGTIGAPGGIRTHTPFGNGF